MALPPEKEDKAPPRAVTFDCWGTLIYERDTHEGYAKRVEAIVAMARDWRVQLDPREARAALDRAWHKHWEAWHGGTHSGAADIAHWTLAELDLSRPETVSWLARRFSEVALESEVVPLVGARDTLMRLATAGVRRALVCDTGFSPGGVVRALLDRAGLLEFLEVQIFSDEAGVPKPDPRVFEEALRALGTEPIHAAHVGDLRRTDVAGARAVGMRTVRIRDHHDDETDHPEADEVADSHSHLREILGVDEET